MIVDHYFVKLKFISSCFFYHLTETQRPVVVFNSLGLDNSLATNVVIGNIDRNYSISISILLM